MFDLDALFHLMPVIDILAVVVFAASGALVASRKGLDLLGFMWLAVLTGVGGGTVRDLILDVPVFWVSSPAHVAACLLTAVIVYFTAHLVESRYRLLLWLDALGLALFTVAGTAKGLENDTGALVAIVMGVITGSVGGIVRDVIGGVPSVILRHEIYVTASALGAGCYALLMALAVEPTAAAIAGFLVTFVVRGLAIAYNLHLPAWNRTPSPSPDRDDADSP
ncbi:MAG: trimeric intracellular cation channel family protein [Gammaproteobacteria bacterium]